MLLLLAGSQVFWDSRTVHCGALAFSTDDLPQDLQGHPRIHRNVIYVTMVPLSYASKESLEIRKTIFDENGANRLRSATHQAQFMNLFPVPKPDAEVPQMPMPELNENGKKLAGLF